MSVLSVFHIFGQSQFVGAVKIGTPPQAKYLIFDTGSTTLEVVGVGCTIPTCMKVPRFDFSESSTFEFVHPPVYVETSVRVGEFLDIQINVLLLSCMYGMSDVILLLCIYHTSV